MSRRKRQAIAASQLAAPEQKTREGKSWFRGLTYQPKLLFMAAAFCLFMLLVASISFATQGSFINFTFFSNQSSSPHSSGAPTTTTTTVVNPTPQLSKEYVYAGGNGRLLATEESGTILNPNPTDLVVWRPSNGRWLILDGQNASQQTQYLGDSTQRPCPADFNGDGLFDICIVAPHTEASGNQYMTWWIIPNGTNQPLPVMWWGLPTDTPTPADFDGDGRADYAAYRSSTATFYILNSSTNSWWYQTIGQTGDVPVVADYDGDGLADVATYKLSTAEWRIRSSRTGQMTTQIFGGANNQPVVGDYDGDGRFDLAVRVDGGVNQWRVKRSSTQTEQQITITGITTAAADKSVPGDYDGDGKTDAAVWRPETGYWYIQQSATNTIRQQQWGSNGDTPIAAPFNR